MRRRLTICLLILSCGCGSQFHSPETPLQPTVSPPMPAVPAFARTLIVGEEITDALLTHGTERFYQITVPRDGTLGVHVSWDPSRGRLGLRLADARFAPDEPGTIEGELLVQGGHIYVLRIADGAPWDADDLDLPFDLKTTIR